MIVGNLGTLEIVLLAYDDGDVIAYYTSAIATAIRSEPGHQPDIRPCFHQNVGISAWGLAIHEKSRLIAVSSNNREVTVFVPGYSFGDDVSEEVFALMGRVKSLFSEVPALRPKMFLRGDFHMTSFRRTLKLGSEGHNIPSIDFSNDSNGMAHSVLATDIAGNLWILDIWSTTYEKKRIPSIHRAAAPDNGIM